MSSIQIDPADTRDDPVAVEVRFYPHSIHDRGKMSMFVRGFAVLAERASPRFARCTLVVGDRLYVCTGEGLRAVAAGAYPYIPTAIVDFKSLAARELLDLDIPDPRSLVRLSVMQSALGTLFPTRVPHCSSAIGGYVGFPGARVPDQLYRWLLRNGGIPRRADDE